MRPRGRGPDRLGMTSVERSSHSPMCISLLFVYFHLFIIICCCCNFIFSLPQWGAEDAEIKVPSGDNTELKRSPFKVWSRSVYSHTCYAYCQEFLPRLLLPFRSIHLHFFQNLSKFFPVLAVANTWFLCRPAE